MKRRKLAALILSLAMVTGSVLSPLTAVGADLTAAGVSAAEYTDEEVSGDFEDDAAPEEEISGETYEDETVTEEAYADDDTGYEADAADMTDAEYAEADAAYAEDDAEYAEDDETEAKLQEETGADAQSMAEAVEGEYADVHGGSFSFDEDGLTNDELFQKYIDSRMFENDEAAHANYGETKFKNAKYTLKLYRALKARMKSIGENGGSTVLR